MVTIFHDATKTACSGRVLIKIRPVEEGQTVCRTAFPLAPMTTHASFLYKARMQVALDKRKSKDIRLRPILGKSIVC